VRNLPGERLQRAHFASEITELTSRLAGYREETIAAEEQRRVLVELNALVIEVERYPVNTVESQLQDVLSRYCDEFHTRLIRAVELVDGRAEDLDRAMYELGTEGSLWLKYDASRCIMTGVVDDLDEQERFYIKARAVADVLWERATGRRTPTPRAHASALRSLADVVEESNRARAE